MTAFYRRAGQVADHAFLQKLELIDLYLRQSMNGILAGERRSAREGSSIEWMDYSEYMPGDDDRRVDWNLAARLDKLYVKHFVGEFQTHTRIYLDMSASMDWPDEGRKGLMALRLAAALAYLSVTHMDRVTVGLLRGTSCEQLCESVVGKSGFFRMLPLMDTLEFGGDTDIEQTIKNDIYSGTDQGITIIVSDLLTDSDWKRSVDYLLSLHHQVMVMQLLAPEEVSPLYGGHLALMDVEKNAQDAPLLQQIDKKSLAVYKKTFTKWQEDIKQFCAFRNVAYFSAVSNEKLEEIFLTRGAAAGVIK